MSLFICIAKRSDLKACISDTYTKYFQKHKTFVQRRIVVAFEIGYHIITTGLIPLRARYVFAVAPTEGGTW